MVSDVFPKVKKQGVNVPAVYGVHRLNDGGNILVMETIKQIVDRLGVKEKT